MNSIRLTEYAHGGGCGCKIAPAVLSELLSRIPISKAFPDLLVGSGNNDDAAVVRISDDRAIVATTDFFMPVVDDAYDFGRIAATNALSDVYAMGGTPILALAVVGMPINKLPMDTVGEILAGGAAVCEAAGIPLAGGHSIDAPEPIYGLVAIGLVHPDRVKRNDRAQPGDRLILGKPLGVGILSAALKKGALDAAGYDDLLATTVQLNRIGAELADRSDVHAMTDVTGFGLLGHLLEVCRGSGLGAEIALSRLPVIPAAENLARKGYATGAGDRNWNSYGSAIELPAGIEDWQHRLLCDPQTSGGLLLAIAPDAERELLELFHARSFERASVIGTMRSGDAKVSIVG